MAKEMENLSAMTVSTASGEASVSSSGNQAALMPTTSKRKRNLPGMPDPNAEVIALSPKTLMATNRFVCEICNKGFQRDQNLQLHRRGHNLPWKLRQRTSKEIRKRVYICPEVSCVHHDPLRALGDLTGIKKHFCRKHGEKKWKCDKCLKKYAVQSDWKAHLKTCGTKEYKCDCGTIFSRRDSFITHRAFCDALAVESAKAQPVEDRKSNEEQQNDLSVVVSSPPPQSSSVILSAVVPIQNQELFEEPNGNLQDPNGDLQNPNANLHPDQLTARGNGNSSGSSNGSSCTTVFTSVFSTPSVVVGGNMQPQTSAFSDLVCAMANTERPTALAPTPVTEPPLLCLSVNTGFTLFGTTGQESPQFARPTQPAMSATALLQKAAEMGAAASSASLFHGFGISGTSSSGQQKNLQWNHNETEPAMLGLGLPGNGSTSLTEFMMGGPSLLLGPRPATHDFLGLGMPGGGSPTGFSALIQSMNGGGSFDVVGPASATSLRDIKPEYPRQE